MDDRCVAMGRLTTASPGKRCERKESRGGLCLWHIRRVEKGLPITVPGREIVSVPPTLRAPNWLRHER